MTPDKNVQNKMWALGQNILILLILFIPFNVSFSLPLIVRCLGALLVISGTMLFVFARKSLKRNMVVSPKPVAGGYLIQSGIYGIIRHPGYVGIFMASFGVSLWKHDLVRIILSLCLLILFDVKTRIEESWLSKTYADYDQYKIAVKKKFIPWIY